MLICRFTSLLENTLAEPCKNKMDDANCEHWAGLGFCQSKANLMLDKCQRACNSCPKGIFNINPKNSKTTEKCNPIINIIFKMLLPSGRTSKCFLC